MSFKILKLTETYIVHSSLLPTIWCCNWVRPKLQPRLSSSLYGPPQQFKQLQKWSLTPKTVWNQAWATTYFWSLSTCHYQRNLPNFSLLILRCDNSSLNSSPSTSASPLTKAAACSRPSTSLSQHKVWSNLSLNHHCSHWNRWRISHNIWRCKSQVPISWTSTK